MKFATGTIVGGKVVVEGEPFPEGAVVTVFSGEGEASFVVPAELEAELQASFAEAERGETVSADELLQRLPRSR